jgi:hypothetical protein
MKILIDCKQPHHKRNTIPTGLPPAKTLRSLSTSSKVVVSSKETVI